MMTNSRSRCVAWTLLLATLALTIVSAHAVLGTADGTDDSEDSAGSYLADARLLDLTLDSDEDFLDGDYAGTQDADSLDDDMQDGTVVGVSDAGVASGLKYAACIAKLAVDALEAGKSLICGAKCEKNEGAGEHRSSGPTSKPNPKPTPSDIGGTAKPSDPGSMIKEKTGAKNLEKGVGDVVGGIGKTVGGIGKTIGKTIGKVVDGVGKVVESTGPECVNNIGNMITTLSGVAFGTEGLLGRISEFCVSAKAAAEKCGEKVIEALPCGQKKAAERALAGIQALCGSGAAVACVGEAQKEEADLELSQSFRPEQALPAESATTELETADAAATDEETCPTAPPALNPTSICSESCESQKNKYGYCKESCKCNLLKSLGSAIGSFVGSLGAWKMDPPKVKGATGCELMETVAEWGKCGVNILNVAADVASGVDFWTVVPKLCGLLNDCENTLRMIPGIIAVKQACNLGDLGAQIITCSRFAGMFGGISMPEACRQQIEAGQAVGYLGCPSPYMYGWMQVNPCIPGNPPTPTDPGTFFETCRQNVLDGPGRTSGKCKGFKSTYYSSDCPANQARYSCIKECILQAVMRQAQECPPRLPATSNSTNPPPVSPSPTSSPPSYSAPSVSPSPSPSPAGAGSWQPSN